MLSKYKAGVDCINKKNYPEAKKILSEITKDKSDKDRPIALGAMGYCLYKEKNYYGARKYFENKDFLKSSEHHDFQRYVIIWATTYFNQGLYEHLQNIIISLKYCDNKGTKKGPRVNEKLYLLKDRNGKAFDEQHPVVMFIKGLIKWKIDKRLGEAECLIKNSRIEVGKVFLEKVQKEKKVLDQQISESINASRVADFSLNYAETILKSSDQNDISMAQDYLKKRIESGTEGLEEEKLLLARSYAQNKNLELALTLYTQIAENYKQKSHGDEAYKKKTAELYVEMAKYCLESADRNYSLKCREYLTEADNLLPSLNEISLLLGDYFYQSGNFKDAYKSFYRYKALHEMDDPSLETRIYLANIELSEDGVIKEDFPDANQVFEPGAEGNVSVKEFLRDKPDEEKLKEFDYIQLNEKMIADKDIDNTIKKDIIKSEDLKGEDCPNIMRYGGYEKPFIYYEKSIMNLYDYIHKGITDDFDKDDDDIKYYQKIRIIKQITEGMIQYLKGKGTPIENLNPYNVYIIKYQDEKHGEEMFKVPIIKIGFLTHKVLIPEDLSYQKNIWKYGNKEFSIYSLAVLIWEIFSRKIPFEGYKDAKTGMAATNYFNKEKLSTEPLLSNIPLKIYDFFYKIMNKSNGLASTNDLEIIKKLLNEVKEFPEDEFIPKEEDLASRDETNIHYSIDNSVSRFFNRTQFDSESEFREGIEDIVKCDIDSPYLVKYLGCAVLGEVSVNWYFYTEKLEKSLARILKYSDPISDKRKIIFLKDICNAVQLLDGTKGYYINCIDPAYIFQYEGKEGQGKRLKILNYGKDFEFLQKEFYTLPVERNEAKTFKDVKDSLIFDFINIFIRMFQDYAQGNNDAAIKKYLLQVQQKGKKEFVKELSGILINYIDILNSNVASIDFPQIEEHLETLDKLCQGS